MILFFAIIAYLALGIYTYALVFTYFQNEYPSLAAQEYENDMWFAIKIGLCGPIGLLGTIVGLWGCNVFGHKLRLK